MNYNWKEVEFELDRKSKLIQDLLNDRKELIKAMRLLHSDCVNKDASSVIDGDAFIESRLLLTKMNVTGS